jgi:periplasmic protein CpxP/Spy
METDMTMNGTNPRLQTLAHATPSSGGPRTHWRRPLTFAGLFVGVLALGAGAYAATGATDMAWRESMRLAFVQRAVSHALDGVGASAEQEAKIHDIVAAKFAELGPIPEERAAMRKQALDLLAAPTIDRAAVEKLRLDVVAKFDARSKTVAAGLLDIADQLTPDQRTKLVAEVEAMAERGPGKGPWGGWGHWGHGMRGGPDGDPDRN